jgi:Tfp pilus assembly protein PilO
MNNRILPLVSLGAAIAIFFVYVNPVWSGPVATLSTAISADNQALAASANYVQRENQLAQERDAIDPTQLSRAAALLPDSVDNVGLILDLNALASRSGLQLSNIDVSQAADGSGATQSSPVGSVDLTLSAIGSYTALGSFLHGIEQSARILDIQDLSISGSATGVYSYKMSIRLYWLR